MRKMLRPGALLSAITCIRSSSNCQAFIATFHGSRVIEFKGNVHKLLQQRRVTSGPIIERFDNIVFELAWKSSGEVLLTIATGVG